MENFEDLKKESPPGGETYLIYTFLPNPPEMEDEVVDASFGSDKFIFDSMPFARNARE